jgi:hypothetical protein
MQRPIYVVALGCAVLLTACQGGDTNREANDVAAADTQVTQTPGGTVESMTLAEMAGRWSVEAVPESGSDMSPTRYTLAATPDRNGWSITFEDGTTVPMTVVAVEGDSVIVESGSFASQRRADTQVHTRSAMRVEGDSLIGWTRARYETTGADTVLMLRTVGTRAP